ncbi:hypothetical protein [Lachnobacterium bovis]|uniref:hypothetical protein n=1 Tax=Lachnobacterium bovis TaxID=140626 RepID=UPI0003B64352|nr:hypothetical protein [Lachnobacterium bovis]
MKLQELKNVFKNRFTVKVIAGVLSISMIATGASVYSVYAEKTQAEEVQQEKEETVDELVDKESNTVSEKDIEKEETVYVLSNASGKAKKTIVSEHLLNKDKKDSIEDKSDLSNIKNVNGDEKFTRDGDNLKWEANGKEIYYQGTTKKEAPITQKITYKLDGKEISPKELAGKSGKVTIRYDFTNNTSFKEKVNGEDVEVCVPFAAVTGLSLDSKFSNVEITNGKLVNVGEKTMAIGYALPGVKDSLGVTNNDFTGDVNIPNYIEVTADVKDFELEGSMTAVVNAASLMDKKTENNSDLDSMVNELVDATNKLQNGSKELSDGIGTLDSKFKEYASGIGVLQNGIKEYTNGASKVADGANTLNNGVKTLASSLPALSSGLNQLASGVDQAKAGSDKLISAYSGNGTAQNPGLYNVTQQLKQGVASFGPSITASIDNSLNGVFAKVNEALKAYNMSVNEQNHTQVINAVVGNLSQQLASLPAAGMPQDQMAVTQQKIITTIASLEQAEGAINTLQQTKQSLSQNEGIGKLQAAVNGIAQYVGDANTPNSLYGGTVELSKGLGKLQAGTSTINSKVPELLNGVNKLTNGTQQLANGSNTLVSNNAKLNNGVDQLNNATGQLTVGIAKLNDGSKQLSDGIVKFNDEGISKIVNSYNGDLKPFANKLQAMLDASKDYNSFAGISENTKGNVKFVYKVAEIKK